MSTRGGDGKTNRFKERRMGSIMTHKETDKRWINQNYVERRDGEKHRTRLIFDRPSGIYDPKAKPGGAS